MAHTDTSNTVVSNPKGKTKTSAPDQIREVAEAAQERLHAASDAVKETTTQVAQNTANAAQSFQSDFDKAVSRNPTLAVLGAVGFGMVIGMAMSRRS